MSSNLVETARTIPLAERIELIEVWESITQEGYEPQLTVEQAAELDRRLEAHRLDPDAVVPWDTVKKDLLKRYRNR